MIKNLVLVWKYFDKVESKSVTCKVCKQKFAFHGGTTNLRDHFQRSHGAMYVPESAGSSGQKKIESVLKVQKCSAERTKILDNLIIGLTVRGSRPTRIVEGKGFQKLMEYCEPGYTTKASQYNDVRVICERKSATSVIVHTYNRLFLVTLCYVLYK